MKRASLFALVLMSCTTPSEPSGNGGKVGVGGEASTGSGGTGSGGEAAAPGGPRYHPPAGFEDCIHAEVKADCDEGWCRLPPGCFVMGSNLDEPFRGRNVETQVAVQLTNPIQFQQTEMTRGEWRTLTKTETSPDPTLACLEDDCPVTMVTWWEAIHAANLLSEQEGLEPCYRPVDCTGTLGEGLVCQDFENPLDKVYDCEGYRLPTQAESEYAARAGTITAFYSGDINPIVGSCVQDENLAKVAWFCANSGGKTHPVKQLAPNDWGIYDQLGNVMEWLQDVNYFSSSPGGNNPRGEFALRDATGSAARRYLRGGRVSLPNMHSRAAGGSGISWDAYNEHLALVGFRLVRTLQKDE